MLVRNAAAGIALSEATVGLEVRVRAEGLAGPAKADGNISGARRFASSAPRKSKLSTIRMYACWRGSSLRAGRSFRGV